MALEDRVIVVVREGAAEIYKSQGLRVSIEVLDLDEPAFLTNEERQHFSELRKKIAAVESDPNMTQVW